MGRDSPPSYLNGSNPSQHSVNLSPSFDPNCIRNNDFFYLSPSALLHSPMGSPSMPPIGGINTRIGDNMWNSLNLSHSPLSPPPLPSPLHSGSINLTQTSPLSKQMVNPWSSALLSAYMLQLWPNGSNGSQTGRVSPTGLHSLKSSSGNTPLIHSNHIQYSGVQQQQQSMLEILRQTAQHHQHSYQSCSTDSQNSDNKSNKEQSVSEGRDGSPKKT